MTTLEHLPEKYFTECQFHQEPVEEDFDEDQIELYWKANDDYWDEHFRVGEDGILACEDSYIGIHCPTCSDELDWPVVWPCPEAIINDYVIEQALQKSQNPLHDPTRPEILTKTG